MIYIGEFNVSESYELLWVKGRVYELEVKLSRILKLLQEHDPNTSSYLPLHDKVIKVLQGKSPDS